MTEGAWRRGAHRLEAGFELRRLGENLLSRRWGDPAPRVLSDFRLTGWPWGAFVQDSWAAPGGRLTVTVGGRVDHLDTKGETVVLPRAAVDLALTERTRLTAAFGAYAQFPRFDELAGETGNPDLEAERSRHFVVWAAEGRDEAPLERFFDLLGTKRSTALQFVTADGASWIGNVLKRRCPQWDRYFLFGACGHGPRRTSVQPS